MKTIHYNLIAFLLMAFNLQAQVGIGTENPDPSSILDIYADNKGVLIPKVALQSKDDGATVLSPAKGLIVYNTNTTIIPNSSNSLSGEGFYINYGDASSPNWTTFTNYKSENYMLFSAYSDLADNRVDYTHPDDNSYIKDDLDLGLEVAVTIPAQTTSQVIVNYSTPVGTFGLIDGENTYERKTAGYYGIRFLKDGLEQLSGSRKYSIPLIAGGVRMVSIGATYVEYLENPSSEDIEVTYSLNGYIEKLNTDINENFRFNMWVDPPHSTNPADPGYNYNWGTGTISAQVYVKPL